ncbi:MAG: O-antigen ligase family protein [Candidatus Sumerlaeia bacterium]|nr:O-antigen ligase family protein [Candidatus Sumerlaeia bacterium]
MNTSSKSRLARKPPQLFLSQEVARRGGAVHSFSAGEQLGALARRGAELALLTALLAVPLMYVYLFSNETSLELLDRLARFAGAFGGWDREARDAFQKWIWIDQLQFYLGGFAPVLEMKFFAWAACTVLLLPFLFFGVCLERLKVARVFEFAAPDASRRALRWAVRLSALGFLAWSALSLRLWPPEFVPDFALPQGLPDSGGGGFFHSLTALLQVAAGLAFYFCAEFLLRSRLLAYKAVGLLISVGVLCAAVSALQHVAPGLLDGFWVRFVEADHRNALGSFIGHNTGLSSFLIAPTLLLAALLFGTRNSSERWMRAAIVGALGLIGYVLVLAQSRAVVPILVLCLLLFRMLAWRFSLLRVPRHYILGGLALAAVLVVSQLVVSDLNPLARRDITITQRLNDVSGERLLAETRLRILAIGIPMVLDAPLLGHGFGAFQYIYPDWQGAYFEEHPRSLLAPTALRSFHAHNEYLQTMIETGAVGLGLALAGLFAALRLGWLAMGSTLTPTRTILQAGIFAAALGLLLHAGADFPLRIPPLAMTLAVLLAMLSSGDQLWLAPLADPEQPPAPGSTVREPAPANTVAAVYPALPTALAMLMTVTVALVAAQVFSATACRWFSGTLLRADAQRMASTAGAFVEQRTREGLDAAYAELAGAKERANSASYYIPASGPLQSLEGQLYVREAELVFREAEAAGRSGDERRAAELAAYATNNARTGISKLRAALGEETFHFSHATLFRSHRLLARYVPEAEAAEHLAESMRHLRKAVSMNPGDVVSYSTLLELLASAATGEAGDPSEEEAVAVAATLDHFAPQHLRETLYRDALDAAYWSDYRTSHGRMRIIARAVAPLPGPERWAERAFLRGHREAVLARRREFLGAFATIALRARQSGDARDAVRMLLADETRPGDYRLLSSLIAAREGAFEEASRLLGEAGAETEPLHPAFLATYRYALARRLASSESGVPEALREAFGKIAEATPQDVQVAAACLFEMFGDEANARPLLDLRIGIDSPPADAQTLTMRLRIALAERDRVTAERLLTSLRQQAATPFQRELFRRLQQAVSELGQPEAPAP